MQDSQELKSYRGNRLTSSFKQSAFAGISKSLTIAQSQGKQLERYLYRRQLPSSKKNDRSSNTKLSINKSSSYHEANNNNKRSSTSASNNNIMNEKNEIQENKSQDLIVQLPNLSKLKLQPQQDKQQVKIQLQLQHQQANLATPHKNKIFRRTSDWTMLYHKSVRPLTKNKKIQSSQIKLKIESKITRQKINQSNIQIAIRKHKADNVKQIQQKMRSVMSRIGLSDPQKLMSMKDYNRKCGYNQNDKIFIWNSQDEHIRRVLSRWGWIQNPNLQSPFFHLKWTYMPIFAEEKINQKQLINHFKNTQEITSKSYLSKNLKLNQSTFGKIDQYFPKCFDVGNTTQFNYFIEEYRHNVMLILLKRIYNFCRENRADQMHNFDVFYGYHFRHDAYHGRKTKAKHYSIYRKRGFRQIKLEEYKNRCLDFLLQINLVIEVLRYWRNFRKEKQEFEDQEQHFFKFKKSQFLDIFPILQTYSALDNIGEPKEDLHFSKQLFSTPSSLLLQRIAKQYQFCKQTNSLYSTYGQNNIWIVKPTSNSRGSGIYLTKDLYQIQSSSKGIQSRLVQKYIQKPLIFKQEQFNELYMRKFDLRQWVLLKSIDPLEIYMFSQCYLRLCYDQYKEDQVTQLFRHLTNYSINKAKFKNKNQSVLPLSYLKQALKKQYNLDWNKSILPKIEKIIIKSIKSCIQNLQDCQSNCFELLGFDILIDQQFNPWLLEINMSPACQERTTWLTQYLNDMSVGLLKIILPQELLPQKKQKTKYKWNLILKQQAFFNRKKDVQQGLQICGTNVRLDYEKVKDRQLLKNQMAIKIQKFFKTYLPKYRQYKHKKSINYSKISYYINSFKQQLLCKQEQTKIYTRSLQKYIKSLLQQSKHDKITSKNKILQIERFISTIRTQRQFEQIKKEYNSNYIAQETGLKFISINTQKANLYHKNIKSNKDIFDQQKIKKEEILKILQYFYSNQAIQLQKAIIYPINQHENIGEVYKTTSLYLKSQKYDHQIKKEINLQIFSKLDRPQIILLQKTGRLCIDGWTCRSSSKEENSLQSFQQDFETLEIVNIEINLIKESNIEYENKAVDIKLQRNQSLEIARRKEASAWVNKVEQKLIDNINIS